MSKELSPKYNPAEVEVEHSQKRLHEDVLNTQGVQKSKTFLISISTTKRN